MILRGGTVCECTAALDALIDDDGDAKRVVAARVVGLMCDILVHHAKWRLRACGHGRTCGNLGNVLCVRSG